MKPVLNSLILDLDGTLLDSKTGIVESFGRAAQTVFPDLRLDLSKVPVGPPIRKICHAVFPDISEADTERLAQAYRLFYDAEGCVKTRLYEGAVELLSALTRRGHTLDVATNKPMRVTTTLLSHLKIDRFFRCVMTVDATDPPLPGKAAIIKRLLTLHCQRPELTVFVGDTAEDADAASACGIHFIWAAYGYGKPDFGVPVFASINRLAELLDIL